MTDFSIFKANSDNFDDIRELMLTALKHDPYGFSVTYDEYYLNSLIWWESYIRIYFNGEKDFMLLAEVKDKIIGMIGVLYDYKKRKNHTASIVWVYVEEEYRGKGIGKELMNQALKFIEEDKSIRKATLLVNETQSAALKIYKDLGFEQAGKLKDDVQIDGEYINTLILEKYFSRD